MEDNGIKNVQIRESSVRHSTTASGWQARLRKNIPKWGAWCPDTSGGLETELSSDQYIQIDLLALKNITRIATQGREYNGGSQFVSKYLVSHSNEGRKWNYYYKHDDPRDTFNNKAKVDSSNFYSRGFSIRY